jgi:taurine dioxygenase
MVTRAETSSTSALSIDVHPLSGYVGAEILGVDLRNLTIQQIADIRRALLKWKVVFFRDQHLTQAEQVAFGSAFGEVTPAHPVHTSPFSEQPEILPVNVGTDPLEGPMMEGTWHSDATFLLDAPMAAILRVVTVPPYGGDTGFLNRAYAYEQLSPEIRDLIDRLHAVHHNHPAIERGDAPEIAQRFLDRGEYRTVHPVVRVHPETGERLIFVNPSFTSHIVELTRKEGAHILALLYEHMSKQKFTCRFRWQPGSIAFWDERATCHHVPNDVHPGFERKMERITLAGDIPVGVDGQSSYSLAGKPFTAAPRA